MSHAITEFSKRMRHKLHEVEHRLDALHAATQKQVAHADEAIHTHLLALDAGSDKATELLDQARTDVAAWMDDAKATVAGWKERLDVKMLEGRADRAERYAEAAMVVAFAGVDQAERAMLAARLARGEADVIRAF